MKEKISVILLSTERPVSFIKHAKIFVELLIVCIKSTTIIPSETFRIVDVI